jgi:hypothetical protein
MELLWRGAQVGERGIQKLSPSMNLMNIWQVISRSTGFFGCVHLFRIDIMFFLAVHPFPHSLIP